MDVLDMIPLEFEIETFDFGLTEQDQEPSNEKKIEFLDLLKQYVNASNQLDYYWEHCSFKTYKATLNERLENYLAKYIDGEPIDFYKEEYNNMDNYIDRRYAEIFERLDVWPVFRITKRNHIYFDFLDDETQRNFELAYEKKTAFLKEKIDSIKTKPETTKETIKTTPQPEIDFDLIDTTGVEKIILLEKLGVLDYIKTKYPYISVNNLASLLSGFTGMNQGTLQSYLNPMYNDTADQKNNPLNSTAKVEKIETILKKIGISNY